MSILWPGRLLLPGLAVKRKSRRGLPAVSSPLAREALCSLFQCGQNGVQWDAAEIPECIL